jgi:hypothetical protein
MMVSRVGPKWWRDQIDGLDVVSASRIYVNEMTIEDASASQDCATVARADL